MRIDTTTRNMRRGAHGLSLLALLIAIGVIGKL
jgi:hypothetical protein